MKTRHWWLPTALCIVCAATLFGQSRPLDSLLDDAAKNVSGYLDKISDVRCTETVRQIKLDLKGHAEYSEESVYDYFVLLQANSDELLLDESRLAKHEPRYRKNTPMLISNGFSMLYLIFHPYYRNSFQFTSEPDALIDGRLYHRIHFAHLPGNRTPAAISVRGREYPLDLTGEAWFDSASGMITLIQATVSRNMQDIGLRSLSVEIKFAPVSLPEWTQTLSFPVSTTVELESLRQRWRNEHRFTDYKRFMVETRQTVDDQGLRKNE